MKKTYLLLIILITLIILTIIAIGVVLVFKYYSKQDNIDFNKNLNNFNTITESNINDQEIDKVSQALAQEYGISIDPEFELDHVWLSPNKQKIVYTLYYQESEHSVINYKYRIYYKEKNQDQVKLYYFPEDKCGLKPTALCFNDYITPVRFVDDNVVLLENFVLLGSGHVPVIHFYTLNLNSKEISALSAKNSIFYDDFKKVIYTDYSDKSPLSCEGPGASTNDGKIILKDVVSNDILFQIEEENTMYNNLEIKDNILIYNKTKVKEVSSQQGCVELTKGNYNYELNLNDFSSELNYPKGSSIIKKNENEVDVLVSSSRIDFPYGVWNNYIFWGDQNEKVIYAYDTKTEQKDIIFNYDHIANPGDDKRGSGLDNMMVIENTLYVSFSEYLAPAYLYYLDLPPSGGFELLSEGSLNIFVYNDAYFTFGGVSDACWGIQDFERFYPNTKSTGPVIEFETDCVNSKLSIGMTKDHQFVVVYYKIVDDNYEDLIYSKISLINSTNAQEQILFDGNKIPQNTKQVYYNEITNQLLLITENQNYLYDFSTKQLTETEQYQFEQGTNNWHTYETGKEQIVEKLPEGYELIIN